MIHEMRSISRVFSRRYVPREKLFLKEIWLGRKEVSEWRGVLAICNAPSRRALECDAVFMPLFEIRRYATVNWRHDDAQRVERVWIPEHANRVSPLLIAIAFPLGAVQSTAQFRLIAFSNIIPFHRSNICSSSKKSTPRVFYIHLPPFFPRSFCTIT